MSDTPAPALEVLGEDTVQVHYGEHIYVFPASIEDAEPEALEELELGRLAAGLKSLMGAKQYAAFKATKPKVRNMKELFETYAKLIGFETGE